MTASIQRNSTKLKLMNWTLPIPRIRTTKGIETKSKMKISTWTLSGERWCPSVWPFVFDTNTNCYVVIHKLMNHDSALIKVIVLVFRVYNYSPRGVMRKFREHLQEMVVSYMKGTFIKCECVPSTCFLLVTRLLMKTNGPIVTWKHD